MTTTNKTVLVTGASSGLGLALAKAHLELGHRVYTFARRNAPIKQENLTHYQVDLNQAEKVQGLLQQIAEREGSIEKLYLNAGVLGPMDKICEISINQAKQVMDTNLWSQYNFIQTLYQLNCLPKEVIAISSGAALKGSMGWGTYNLSKSAFLRLVEVWAQEIHDTFFLSLAPGLVQTDMQATLRKQDLKKLPGLKRFHQANDQGKVLAPEQVVKKLFHHWENLRSYDSGSYVDLRDLD